MYENQILDSESRHEGLVVTQAATAALSSAATWSMVMAIFGFIAIGFMVLAGIFMGVAMGAMGSAFQEASKFPFPMWILSLFYLVIAALYFFPVLFLYRFASQSKQALRLQDSNTLASALTNLAYHYKWIVIMMIALIAMYIILVIGVVGMAASSGF